MLCLSRLSLLVSRTLDCLALFFSSVSRHLFLIVSLIPYFICCFYCLFFFSFLLFFFFFFFFSSRRRHTRSLCDWSSDVCSSDLVQQSEFVAFPFSWTHSASSGKRPRTRVLRLLLERFRGG